jgi:hypothetical protein
MPLRPTDTVLARFSPIRWVLGLASIEILLLLFLALPWLMNDNLSDFMQRGHRAGGWPFVAPVAAALAIYLPIGFGYGLLGWGLAAIVRRGGQLIFVGPGTWTVDLAAIVSVEVGPQPAMITLTTRDGRAKPIGVPAIALTSTAVKALIDAQLPVSAMAANPPERSTSP